MKLENTFTVPVPVAEAWRTLLDVEQIAPCLPGATVESVQGDEVIGRVKVKLGPIALTYRGMVTFVERDEERDEWSCPPRPRSHEGVAPPTRPSPRSSRRWRIRPRSASRRTLTSPESPHSSGEG